MSGNVTKFVERMKYWCQTVSLGYDQSNRQDFRDGGETDCSALVIHALKEAGFDTGSATYTGNMRSNLTKHGWKVVANNGNPQAGDILLNDVNHVAVYIGGGELAQASIDERGRITGGRGGDQTGRETNISNYYNYPWNCYLRYGGAQTSTKPTSNDWIAEKGHFKLNTAIKLRKGPSTSYGEIATLGAGSVVIYDAYKIDLNGYVWIRQKRGNGYGYMATGRSKNGRRVDYWGRFY
ncbi:endolysin-like domain-containing protein [Enterococcus gallinarum]|uniref:NlpC/P60 family protein n=1 Tax=Enterococcus gallinarum TaxID=1353 RepID=UPI00374EADF7